MGDEDEFTITNVKDMSNEKANEINKAAEEIDGMIDILEGQEKRKYRDKNVAHRGFEVDGEVTVAFLNAVKGISTIKDKEYAFLVDPIIGIDYKKTLQNVRKGNYGYMEETKNAQKSINAYMRKYGLSIEVKPTLGEKRTAMEIIKSTIWKRGNDFKKKREGPNDYEVSIDKEGKGSISFYSNDEKLKTVNFQIGKDGKINFDKTTLYQILEDGWIGVETLRALSVVLNDIAERNRVKEPVAMKVSRKVEETPIPVIKLALSTTEYYEQKMSNYRGDTEKAFGEIMEPVYSRASKMDYETESNLRRGGTQMITNPVTFYEKYYARGEGANEDIKKDLINPFLEKYPEDEKVIPSGFISIEKIDGKSKKFVVDLQEIDKDFDYMVSQVNKNVPLELRKNHLELIETSREYVKERVKKISEESENSGEFLKNLNKDKAYSVYLGLLTNYCNMPGVINIFESVDCPYIKALNLLENNEDKKRLKKFKERAYVNLESMKNSWFEKDRELYYRLTHRLVDAAITVTKNPYEKGIVKSDSSKDKSEKVMGENEKKKEAKEVKSAVAKMMPKKSPSQEELDALEKNIKENSLIADLYVQWFNTNAEKQGIEKRLSKENRNELFNKMGVDFWKELKEPGPTMNKLLRDFESSLNEVTDQKEYAEFENYVKMRTYEGNRKFHLQMDNLNGKKLMFAVQFYGVDFILRDKDKMKEEVKKMAKTIEKDRNECGAFQIFVNEYYGKKVLVEDNIIGDKTKKHMYDNEGNPSALLMIYNQMKEQNQKERTRLLDQASKNESARVTQK